MTVIDNLSPNRPVTSQSVKRNLIGAVIGGAFGFGLIELMGRLGIRFKGMPAMDLVAIVIVIEFFGFALVLAYLSADRKRLASTIECEGTPLPASDEEVRDFRLQAAVLALAGLMMLIPIVSTQRIQGHAGRGLALFLATVTLFAIQTLLNIRLWRNSDEFARRTLLIVAAVTFSISQGLLFLTGAAERLQLIRTVSNWNLCIAMMALYLSVSVVTGLRFRSYH